jgi:hypothetical protein
MFFEERKNGVAWLVAGVWQLKGITRNTVKRRCPLCLGEEDMKRILLDRLKTRNWRRKLLNENSLSRNKDIASMKTLRCTNKDKINLGKDLYLDKVECKWFKIISANMYGS